MQTLHGTLLQPQSAEVCNVNPHTTVQIGDDGKFADVKTAACPAPGALGGTERWILPGFIDGHVHVPQWDRRGLDCGSLFQWLESVAYPAEQRMDDPAFAECLAEGFVTNAIAHGTTTVAAFGSTSAAATDRVFQVFARRGLRAIFGQMLNDINCPKTQCIPTDQAIDESRALAVKWHNAAGGLLQYAFSPRMATCCSEKMLRSVVTLADMVGCYILTHIAESADEESKVRDLYPEYFDDVALFDDMGILGPRTILGHGVCLSDTQRRLVAEKNASVVHCPTANLFLQSGLMDYVAHRRSGIRVMLGSSLAAGPEPFMPQVAVACLQTAKALKVHAVPRRVNAVPTPAEAWWMLTAGAAEALSMADRIGSVTPGHQADCLVVRAEPWIAELPPQQQISALLYTMRPHHIEHVFIAGNRVGPV